LARRQHDAISHRQLVELGFSASAIKHRLAVGRLHRVHRGVYAVGRPALSWQGELMAAVLRCRPRALVSHESAAWAYGIRARRPLRPVEISVPADRDPRPPGIRVHRRTGLADGDTGRHVGIPVTSPIRTLLDLATRLPFQKLESAVNEADKLDLVDPETLRAALEDRSGQPGVRPLRNLLDRHTFRLTDSELERRFLLLASEAGLRAPRTQAHVNGYRVDFFWPELGLVVETDGLRYHRTPAQQARDQHRDQTHTAMGLTCLRFSHADVRAGERVVATLAKTARRLER
jgi:very-short-patch-repair endonuclease